jgi:hypothetical protein
MDGKDVTTSSDAATHQISGLPVASDRGLCHGISLA